MLGDDIRVLARGPGWLFAAWDQAYILDWKTSISIENLDASVAGARKMLKTVPELATINIIHKRMPLPPTDLREYAKKKMAESPPGVRCHATALTERGFWASAMRAAMTGIYMVERTDFPRKVFAELVEAVDWSGEVLGRDRAWCRGALAAAEAIMAENKPE
jgi:hypothetical protein